VQCADLVVARLPKQMRGTPMVSVFAKKHSSLEFLGPCQELGDAIDCGQALGQPQGTSVRLIGRRPRLEFTEGTFLMRWRAVNLAAEDHDVKVIVSF
jgi:hypothetical protein